MIKNMISSLNRFIIEQLLKKIFSNPKTQLLSLEIIKFIIAAVINNLSLILIFQLFLFFIRYEFSLIIIYIFGFFLTLYTNAKHVFNVGEVKIIMKLKYAVVYALICLINYYLFHFIVIYLTFHPRITIFIAILLSSSLSFIMSRKVFKSKLNLLQKCLNEEGS